MKLLLAASVCAAAVACASPYSPRAGGPGDPRAPAVPPPPPASALAAGAPVADVPGPLSDAGGAPGGGGMPGMGMGGMHHGGGEMEMQDGGTQRMRAPTRGKARPPQADGGLPADGGMKHEMPGMKMDREP